jgi:predicted PurR-regulated permease PerM
VALFLFLFSFLLFFFVFPYFFCISCKNVSNQIKPVSKILQNSQQGFKPIGNILSEPKQDFHKGFYKLNKMGLLA